MKELPELFKWLEEEPGPRILKEAIKHYGVEEAEGDNSNPIILDWVDEIGATKRRSDSIAWCATFISAIVKSCGYAIPDERPFKSLSWVDWQEEVKEPSVGDILVFKRKHGGHIGLYVGETEKSFWCLGGNQSAPGVRDSVNIKRISKEKCITIRRPWYECKPEFKRLLIEPLKTDETQQNETSQNQSTPESTDGKANA